MTTGAAPAVAGGAFLDPAAPGFLADPHLVFDELRASGSVVRDPIGWSTLDYRASIAAFSDRSLTPGIDPLLESRGIEALWGEPGRTLTDSEGDDHRRLRRAVGYWFNPRRLTTLTAQVRQLCEDLLAAHGPDDPFDFMADYADLVPSRLFCWMIGAPESSAAELARLSKTLLTVFTATDEMVEPVRAAKQGMVALTQELIDVKRSDPGDDVISMLLAACGRGELDELDVFYLVEELLSASVDNTANTTALAAWTLLNHRDAYDAVSADPDLIPAATEECGRFEPAIRHTIKFALDDTEVAGVPVAAGEFVTIRIAAAHRDPEVFDDPHRFDIDRVFDKPQLAFGSGRHFCLGAALGRMEINEMVRALAVGRPNAQLDDDVRMSRVEAGLVHQMPIRLGPTR